PINTFLPDSKYWKDKNDEIVEQVLTEGLQAGMKTFGETLNISAIDAKSMAQPVSEDEKAQKAQYERMMFWAEYEIRQDRKSTRLNSSHVSISYAVFCLKKKRKT